MQGARYSCRILIKLKCSRQISEKYCNIKFSENPSSGSRVVPCGRVDRQTDRQTDMTKVTVAVRKFANVPKNVSFVHLYLPDNSDCFSNCH